jgi:hypothetical protein
MELAMCWEFWGVRPVEFAMVRLLLCLRWLCVCVCLLSIGFLGERRSMNR